ncbi:hypothetical protein [Oerskovia turbata]
MTDPWTWAETLGLVIVAALLITSAWWAGRVSDRRKKEGRK